MIINIVLIISFVTNGLLLLYIVKQHSKNNKLSQDVNELQKIANKYIKNKNELKDLRNHMIGFVNDIKNSKNLYSGVETLLNEFTEEMNHFSEIIDDMEMKYEILPGNEKIYNILKNIK